MHIFIAIGRRKVWGGIVLLLIAGFLVERWVAVSAPQPAKPMERISTEKKIIALTINVDWGEEYIPGLLEVLATKQARATFFVTGRWAKNHPDMVKAIAEQGHQIENHGYSHPHPDRLSVEANREEIRKTESVIYGLTGYKTRFYAPPYGEKGASGLKAADSLGYTTVLWTLDTVDWRPESTPELISKRIMAPEARFGSKPDRRGAIVLMHPKENTLKALPVILDQMTKEGFSFLTINDLITFSLTGNTTSEN